MRETHYIENKTTREKNGPYRDIEDAKDSAEAWAAEGDDVLIHRVSDGVIETSWTYDGDDLDETDAYEGDVWEMEIDEDDEIQEEDPED